MMMIILTPDFFRYLEITDCTFRKLQVRAWCTVLLRQRKLLSLAEIVVRRWAIRDGWQQSRKKSLLECTMRTKSEISEKENEKSDPQGAKPNRTIEFCIWFR